VDETSFLEENADTHWYLLAKRRMLKRIVQRYIPPGERVLDAGCGPGHLSRDLGCTYSVVSIDIEPHACCLTSKKERSSVVRGSIEHLPFKDGAFSAALCPDVIEHLDDDSVALGELHRVLESGGRLIISVPAFPLLWGLHDRRLGHRRRYRKECLSKALLQAGFRPPSLFYWNSISFFPSLFMRNYQIIKYKQDIMADPGYAQREVSHDLEATDLGRLNRLMTVIIAYDTYLPFGVSLVAVARR
jgi:SAM-dependent methyltransferase